MAKTVFQSYFVLNLFLLFEVSSYSVYKTCNNGSSLFELKKAGSKRLHEECCVGYRQVSNESTSDTTWMKCVPICVPACKNGICQSPGVCACETGYKPDPKQKNNCIPHCSDGCLHGTCVFPEQCYCNHGYEYDLDLEQCIPICTEPCHNGTCVSPENCECYPGYRKSETNECQPYCSVGCDNGHCVSPDQCVCEPGWSHYNDHSVFYPGECFKIALTESSAEGESSTEAESSTEGKMSTDSEVTTPSEIDLSDDAITSTKKSDLDGADGKQDSITSNPDETNNNKFYIIGSLLCTACLIFLVILILKWTKLLDYLLGQSYIIEDKDVTDHNLEHFNS